jgi:hypothetical protein
MQLYDSMYAPPQIAGSARDLVDECVNNDTPKILQLSCQRVRTHLLHFYGYTADICLKVYSLNRSWVLSTVLPVFPGVNDFSYA